MAPAPDNVLEFIVVAADAREYYCHACGQLRLGKAGVQNCGNCGSDNLTTGAVGELNKDALRRANAASR